MGERNKRDRIQSAEQCSGGSKGVIHIEDRLDPE